MWVDVPAYTYVHINHAQYVCIYVCLYRSWYLSHVTKYC